MHFMKDLRETGKDCELTGDVRTRLLIHGMRDNTCRESVVQALQNVPGVQDVHVNLYRAQAVIIHQPSCAAADLIEAVDRLGYAAQTKEGCR